MGFRTRHPRITWQRRQQLWSLHGGSVKPPQPTQGLSQALQSMQSMPRQHLLAVQGQQQPVGPGQPNHTAQASRVGVRPRPLAQASTQHQRLLHLRLPQHRRLPVLVTPVAGRGPGSGGVTCSYFPRPSQRNFCRKSSCRSSMASTTRLRTCHDPRHTSPACWISSSGGQPMASSWTGLERQSTAGPWTATCSASRPISATSAYCRALTLGS
mmetsp:Transcript_9570/g.23714  ORF Transcript_9570/g.23714 Transcript_9570/m.23714 type:complete len:212 (+) Transcript_9570:209-844(+)